MGAALIERVAGGKALPPDVFEQVLARTDGIPLFVEELTKTVLESGLLREEAGEYVLSGPLPPLAIPTTLHGSLTSRLDRLAPVREVAQIGAAIGREFSYALLSAVARLPGPELDAAFDALVRSELVFRLGSPPHAAYSFKHALVRDAARDTLLRSRRHELHAGIATVLEEQFPDIVEQQPELLAQHCTEAGLIERAIAYWTTAGRKSVARSTMVEAMAQLRQGLALVSRLPEDLERCRRELDLQTMLSAALVATKGLASSEAIDAYARAHELCDRLGDEQTLWRVMSGEWNCRFGRADHKVANQIAKDLLQLGVATKNPMAEMHGHWSMGGLLNLFGEFASAAEEFNRIIDIYIPQNHSTVAQTSPFDPLACACAYLSWDLSLLGHLDEARSRSEQSITWSRQLRHPHELAHSLTFAAIYHLICRSHREALALLNELVLLSTEQRFQYWLAAANIMRGRLLAEAGQREDGLALARTSFADRVATGARFYHTFYCVQMAEACECAGEIDEALDHIEGALKFSEETDERWWDAELHRLKGAWMLAHGRGDPSDAEACFRRAIGVAQKQNAKLWELRASTSLVL